jgi:CarD family transcriptional regulator
MYKVGDLIVYGKTGVCRVEEIKPIDPEGSGEEVLYYTLVPLYRTGTAFVPVNSDKVQLRPIISKKEVEDLINEIPSIDVKAYYNSSLSQLIDHYEKSLSSHSCLDLIKLTMSLYKKKRNLEEQNRKFGVVDGRFMKKAEELLFGEFAAVLEIPLEDVPDYIASRVGDEYLE